MLSAAEASELHRIHVVQGGYGGEPYWLTPDRSLLDAAEQAVNHLVDATPWLTSRRGYGNATLQVALEAPDCWPATIPRGYSSTMGGVIMWTIEVDDDHAGMPWDDVPRFLADGITDALFDIGSRKSLGPPITASSDEWVRDSLRDALEQRIRELGASIAPRPRTYERDRSSSSFPIKHASDELRIVDSAEEVGQSAQRFMQEYRQNRFQIPGFVDFETLEVERLPAAINDACRAQAAELDPDYRWQAIGVIASGRAVPHVLVAARDPDSWITSVLGLDPDFTDQSWLADLPAAGRALPPTSFVFESLSGDRDTASAGARALGYEDVPLIELHGSDDAWVELCRQRALVRRRAPIVHPKPAKRRRRR